MSLVLFTDPQGWSAIRGALQKYEVTAIIGAASRPKQHEQLQIIATEFGAKFIAHPRPGAKNERTFEEEIQKLRPDLILSASYSQKIGNEVLQLARYGGVNLHYSLLPRWRGKHPMQWAIIAGDSETGVSLHELTEEFDAGPIIGQKKTPILLGERR